MKRNYKRVHTITNINEQTNEIDEKIINVNGIKKKMTVNGNVYKKYKLTKLNQTDNDTNNTCSDIQWYC